MAKVVPEGVWVSFGNDHPLICNNLWYIKNRVFYEAVFTRDSVETAVLYDTNGMLIETYVKKDIRTLPAPALE